MPGAQETSGVPSRIRLPDVARRPRMVTNDSEEVLAKHKPQTTPRELALLTSSPLGLFGSRRGQLPG